MAGLSSRENSCRHSRVCNFDPIVIKLVTHVGLIKPQIKFENELCGANRRDGTFPEKKSMFLPRGRNIDSIFIKLGILADIIKIIN